MFDRIRLGTAALAFVLAASAAHAGQVVTADGRTLTGDVIVKGNVITVNGPAGLFQFSKDQVKSMEQGDAKPAAKPAAAHAASGTPAAAPPAAVTLPVQVAAKPAEAPAAGPAGKDAPKEKLPVVTIKTSMGEITCELFEDDAPNTVANFINLAEKDFYNGTKFHRVIKDFMLQGGDPNSKSDDSSKWGMGGPGYTFEDEFSSRQNERYALSMANSGPNTNGSQFFIVTKEGGTPWLNGRHTVFGRVLKGQEVADAIEKTKTGEQDRPEKPIVIEKLIIDYKRSHKYEPKTHPGDK